MLTEKFNAVVGQSGGPTAAINATLAGVIKGCIDSDKIETVYGMKNGIEGSEKEDFIALNPFFEKRTSLLDLLASTPAAALGSCRKKVKGEDEIEKIFSILVKISLTIL